MLSTPALWVAFAAMLPLMVVVAITDLKSLKIRNWQVLAVLAIFVITGLWGLPFETFLWRILIGVIVLVVGFGLFAVGVIGGGDAKMAAALIPFVAPVDIGTFLLIYAIVTLILLMVLKLVMHMNRHQATGWLSVDQMEMPARERVFPMGLIFGVTIVIYLGIYTINSLTVV